MPVVVSDELLRSIGMSEEDVAVAPLLAAPEERVRWSAVCVIGLIGVEASSQVPALVRALDDPSEDVRKESIEALGYIGAAAREAAPVLAEIVRSGCRELKWEAAESLAQIGEWSGDAVSAVLECIRDEGRSSFPLDPLHSLLYALAETRPPPASPGSLLGSAPRPSCPRGRPPGREPHRVRTSG